MSYNYRCIGYGITGNNGVAICNTNLDGSSLSHSYTGSGVGEVDFVVSTDDPNEIDSSSVQSEPYPVWDTLFHDEATSSRSAGWTNGNSLSVVTEDGCTKLSSTNSNTTQGTSKITTSVSGDFELDLQVNIPTYSSTVGQYVGVNDTSSQQSLIRLTQTGWHDIKFKRVNGAYSCQIKAVDSSTWSSLPLQYDSATTDSVTVVLIVYNPTGTKYELHYKNLKIYSL